MALLEYVFAEPPQLLEWMLALEASAYEKRSVSSSYGTFSDPVLDPISKK
jgi:hypothetical protein